MAGIMLTRWHIRVNTRGTCTKRVDYSRIEFRRMRNAKTRCVHIFRLTFQSCHFKKSYFSRNTRYAIRYQYRKSQISFLDNIWLFENSVLFLTMEVYFALNLTRLQESRISAKYFNVKFQRNIVSGSSKKPKLTDWKDWKDSLNIIQYDDRTCEFRNFLSIIFSMKRRWNSWFNRSRKRWVDGRDSKRQSC